MFSLVPGDDGSFEPCEFVKNSVTMRLRRDSRLFLVVNKGG